MTPPENPSPSTVRVIHSLARTGATIVCKCLGAMERVMLLSEVHPVGALLPDLPQFNPLAQANIWFNLFTPEDVARIENPALTYADAIELINERAVERGQYLILRDWTHLDFTGIPYVRNPPYRLTTLAELEGRFRVVHTATVRHPIDHWISFQKVDVKHELPLEKFLEGLRRFAERCAPNGFLRYEDFVRDPDGGLSSLCGRLEIPFDPGYRTRWAENPHVTGDPKAVYSSTEIRLPARRPLAPEMLRRFERNEDYQTAIRLFGYAHPK